jgi:hypothetical protein
MSSSAPVSATANVMETPYPASVTIHKAEGSRSQLTRLSTSLNLGQDKRKAIDSLFHPKKKHVATYDTEFQTEACFSIWCFPKSDDSWKTLHSFLCWCFQPRMQMFAIVSSGRMEAMMIVRLSRLGITRSGFETWLETFLGLINMSAGSFFFEKYMDAQMLACLHRIDSTKMAKFTNIGSEWNKDFRILYKTMSCLRSARKNASSATGMQLAEVNYVNMSEEVRNLRNENSELTVMLSDALNELARARENLTLGWNLFPVFPEFSEEVVV